MEADVENLTCYSLVPSTLSPPRVDTSCLLTESESQQKQKETFLEFIANVFVQVVLKSMAGILHISGKSNCNFKY